MTTTPKLLACPFCFAVVATYRQQSKEPDRWVVECDVCGARCGLSPSSEAARTNWNMRETCPAGGERRADRESAGAVAWADIENVLDRASDGEFGEPGANALDAMEVALHDKLRPHPFPDAELRALVEAAQEHEKQYTTGQQHNNESLRYKATIRLRTALAAPALRAWLGRDK